MRAIALSVREPILALLIAAGLACAAGPAGAEPTPPNERPIRPLPNLGLSTGPILVEPVRPFPQMRPDPALPKVQGSLLDRYAGRVVARISGVGVPGGSAVGGDGNPVEGSSVPPGTSTTRLALSSPRFLVLFVEGALDLPPVVPGEAGTHRYFFVYNKHSAAIPPCNVNRNGFPLHPDYIQTERRGGNPLRYRTRYIELEQHPTRVIQYGAALCVAGTGESVSSNPLVFQVYPGGE